MSSTWKELSNKVDAYIVCSTQNQMINYIPYKIFQKKDRENLTLYNITYKHETTRFTNKKWDENLQNLLNEGKIVYKNIELDREFNQDKYVQKFRDKMQFQEGKVYIWNITGGQRSVILTILNFLERGQLEGEHAIIYLEGNTNQIICKLPDSNKWQEVEDYSSLNHNINIETALALANFSIAKTKEKADTNLTIFEDILGLYCKDDNLVELFCQINKDVKDNSVEGIHEEFLQIISNSLERDKDEIESELKKFVPGENTNYAGYYLECMAYVALDQAIKNINKKRDFFVDEVYSNVYVKNEGIENNTKDNRNMFCEFDLAIMTKGGQVVIFECKSGRMDSENAKSRNYTAYAVGGVYGKPILITPLTAKQLKDKKLDKEIYGHIKSTIKAARRAGLEYWGIDEIETGLSNLFFGTGGKES